jgi:hypothetical protein
VNIHLRWWSLKKRKMKRIKALLSSVLALLFLSTFSHAQIFNSDQEPCMECAELKNLILPDVIISQASQLDDPVSHCKILGIKRSINIVLCNFINNNKIRNLVDVARYEIK